MQRQIMNYLQQWRTSEHKPLILRGARQVGKSHTVEEFARRYFDNHVTLNFEQDATAASCFSDLNPETIIKKVELAKNTTITPGETLLFLDEIQAHPKAIMALRYFKEQCPQLHVIAAGSLLEFAFESENFSMPVGRVSFAYLHPLSYQEFLLATDKQHWLNAIDEADIKTNNLDLIHEPLLEHFKDYMICGGMPEVVKHYIDTNSLATCKTTQLELLQSYQADIAKYAVSHADAHYIQLLLEKVPGLVSQSFKYSHVSNDIQARSLKPALWRLVKAGIVHQVFHSAASGIPLSTVKNDKKFKLFMLDVGLLQAAAGIDAAEIKLANTLELNAGAIAEQIVMSELINLSPAYEINIPYYWSRDIKSSRAEVDFVMQFNQHIIPIEVKAGSTGRLKSLQLFMQEKNSPVGVKISTEQLSYDDKRKLLIVPFYMISQLKRLIAAVI